MRILYLQSASVLERQRPVVTATLGEAFPGVEIAFASSPEEIGPGPHPVVIASPLSWLPQAAPLLEGCQWLHLLSAGVEQLWEMDMDWHAITLTNSCVAFILIQGRVCRCAPDQASCSDGCPAVIRYGAPAFGAFVSYVGHC